MAATIMGVTIMAAIIMGATIMEDITMVAITMVVTIMGATVTVQFKDAKYIPIIIDFKLNCKLNHFYSYSGGHYHDGHHY